jgi:hypothetical protein
MKKTRLLAAAIGICTPFTAASLMAAAAPRNDLPAEKQAQIDAAKAHRLAGRPADKAADAGRPHIIQSDEPAATGLLGPVSAPIAGEAFTPANAWAGWVETQTYVQVYAGTSPSNPGQGLLFVVRRHGHQPNADPVGTPQGRTITVSRSGGPVHIVRSDGGRIVVRNSGGHEFRFNPATETFD